MFAQAADHFKTININIHEARSKQWDPRLHENVMKNVIVVIFQAFVLTLNTRYCTSTPNASTPLLACKNSIVCFWFSTVCWSIICWSNCSFCILVTFVLFLLTILLLLLFSNSFIFAFGDTFNASFTRFIVADGGGGVDVFVDRTDDLGDAFMGDAFTKRSAIKVIKRKNR